MSAPLPCASGLIEGNVTVLAQAEHAQIDAAAGIDGPLVVAALGLEIGARRRAAGAPGTAPIAEAR